MLDTMMQTANSSASVISGVISPYPAVLMATIASITRSPDRRSTAGSLQPDEMRSRGDSENFSDRIGGVIARTNKNG